MVLGISKRKFGLDIAFSTNHDVQEMLIDVITLGGNVEEDEDCFALHWN